MATILTFAILSSVLFFLLCVGIYCLPFSKANCATKCGMFIETLFIPIFYYIGDNLYPAFKEYECCDKTCLENVQIASIFFLGFATMALFYSKFFYKYWSITTDYLVDSTKYSMWREITDMIVEMVNIDILYSTLIMLGMMYTSTDSDAYCQRNHVIAGSIIYVGCCLIGVSIQGFLIWKACKCTCIHCNEMFKTHTKKNTQNQLLLIGKAFKCTSNCCNAINTDCDRKDNSSERIRTSTIVGVIICGLLVVYLLVDNHLPLEYSLCSCINRTRINSMNTQVAKCISIARSVFSFLLLVASGIIISLILIVSQKQEQVQALTLEKGQQVPTPPPTPEQGLEQALTPLSTLGQGLEQAPTLGDKDTTSPNPTPNPRTRTRKKKQNKKYRKKFKLEH